MNPEEGNFFGVLFFEENVLFARQLAGWKRREGKRMTVVVPNHSSNDQAGSAQPFEANRPVSPRDEPPLSLEVAIPSQRRAPFFAEAIESAARAAVPGLSLLVFQNSLEPHLTEKDLVAFSGQKRLVCSGSQLKIGPSWNRVLELRQAGWIHLLHNDDWIEPGFYARFLRDL